MSNELRDSLLRRDCNQDNFQKPFRINKASLDPIPKH